MSEAKIFRLFISKELSFSLEIEADTAEDAMTLAQQRLDDPSDDVIENCYDSGFEIHDVEEVNAEEPGVS